MKLERILRLLILCEIIVTVLYTVAGFLLEGTLPAPLREYEESIAAESGATLLPLAIFTYGAIPLLICYIIGWIGLWRLWPPGRIFYSVAWGAGFILVVAMGPTVETSVETVLNDLACVVGGMILGLIFFSDLKARFSLGKRPPPINVQEAS